jgi:hypothetical protein
MEERVKQKSPPLARELCRNSLKFLQLAGVQFVVVPAFHVTAASPAKFSSLS